MQKMTPKASPEAKIITLPPDSNYYRCEEHNILFGPGDKVIGHGEKMVKYCALAVGVDSSDGYARVVKEACGTKMWDDFLGYYEEHWLLEDI